MSLFVDNLSIPWARIGYSSSVQLAVTALTQEVGREICCIVVETAIRSYPSQGTNVSNPDEIVIFMTLPAGVDELIIPGLLSSAERSQFT